MFTLQNTNPNIFCMLIFGKEIARDEMEIESLKTFFEKEKYDGKAISEIELFEVIKRSGKIRIEKVASSKIEHATAETQIETKIEKTSEIVKNTKNIKVRGKNGRK